MNRSGMNTRETVNGRVAEHHDTELENSAITINSDSLDLNHGTSFRGTENGKYRK